MASATGFVARKPWLVPLLYSVSALAAGLTIPRLEGELFPGWVTPMSIGSAIAVYSAVASGMIALTGIVFSLTFVMVQFSATAYTPRIVLWLSRDPVLSHALGIFVATFLYAVSALAGVDRGGSSRVPILSVILVIALLQASVAMFVALVHRVGLLQINRVLVFAGNQGRLALESFYPPLGAGAAVSQPASEIRSAPGEVLFHHGIPRIIQKIDLERLQQMAASSGTMIEVLRSIGDAVFDGSPLLQVANGVIDETELRKTLVLGEGRTFEQDPKYALRLLVDIAIRALSPAVNDPTTAVQALDQIQDLLLRLGRSQLEIGCRCDSRGRLSVIVPLPRWEDFLRLGFDEIIAYGSSNAQVTRRMKALLADLVQALPPQRHEALRYWESRLVSSIARSLPDMEEQREAAEEDRQGLGTPCRQGHTARTMTRAS